MVGLLLLLIDGHGVDIFENTIQLLFELDLLADHTVVDESDPYTIAVLFAIVIDAYEILVSIDDFFIIAIDYMVIFEIIHEVLFDVASDP